MNILKLDRTTDKDLYNLLNKLKIKNFVIISRDQLKQALNNKNIDNIILNLTSSTHWVAINKKHKYYFDSFGQKPIQELKNYNYNKKPIQDIENSYCGQISALFLYYINHDKLENFYKLFHERYDYK